MSPSPNSFVFCSPAKVLSGNKALENLPVELAGMDACRPLILTTAGLASRGMERTMAAVFADSGLTVGFFTGIPAFPDRKLVRALYGLYRDRGHDSLIALGAGPVLDVAKALNIALSGAPEDLEAAAAGTLANRKLRPLTAIPNLDVSGYEMTRYASLSSLSLTAPTAVPELIVLDPRTVLPEARKTTAAAALLTLTQAVEAFLHPGRNQLTDAYAYGATRYVMENLPTALKHPSHHSSRIALANAAFFAQTAFDNLSGGMIFCLGMAMARRCAVSPGLIMGLLLPHGLLLEMDREETPGRDLFLAVGGAEDYAVIEEGMGIRKAVDRFVELLLELQSLIPDFPRSIRDIGLAKSDLEELSGAAGNVGGRGSLALSEVRYLLDKAWETRF
ncbi:MAG TPA: iron-containing alcohol dehydrogenase [Syntrophales bacterium]|nr:iron-containing alcohol dehydrogenase [Syntrophales bacterium]HOU76817.1 iron-containing alcohol dehydrogenase [Syntrophales bacterium]HQG33602.1 iron-containing alcohol dehydrogenase [Syntrophales bacterium]HQI34775.1 iron-containing alcohol dehydrogenase [Syntrophales bacterium]HQJ31355.1 iron-containing alcohol dehydrogenase [Syntrophales bacterium]